jgi:protein SCO1/2
MAPAPGGRGFALPKLTLLQKLLWGVAGVAVIGWLAAIVLIDDRAHSGTARAPGAADIRADFALIDQTGAPVTDEDLRGRWLLVFFGFTSCPDVCPTTMAEVAAARELLGADAAKVRPVLITVDPERDTPEALGDYVAAFDADALGLTGSPEAVAAAARSFRAYFRKAADPSAPDGYSMDHTTYLYLIGPDGTYVDFYRYGIGADALAADLTKRLEK